MIVYYKIFNWGLLVLLLSIFLIAFFSFPINYITNQNININYTGDQCYPKHIKDSILVVLENQMTHHNSVGEDINIALLEDLILQKPYVKKAEVSLDVEGAINAFVSFREPFLRFVKDEKVFYVDAEWIYLPEPLRLDNKLVVVSGDVEGDTGLIDLITVIYDDVVLKELIGGVHYSNYQYVLSSKICETGIVLGNYPSLNNKEIGMLIDVYNFFLENLGCDYCSQINIQYANQIICIK